MENVPDHTAQEEEDVGVHRIISVMKRKLVKTLVDNKCEMPTHPSINISLFLQEGLYFDICFQLKS